MSVNLSETRLGELLVSALGADVIDNVKDLCVSVSYNCARHEMCLLVKSKDKNKDKSKVGTLKIIYRMNDDVITCPNNIDTSLINDIWREIKASRELLLEPIIESYTEKINTISNDISRCGSVDGNIKRTTSRKKTKAEIPLNVAVQPNIKEHFDM